MNCDFRTCGHSKADHLDSFGVGGVCWACRSAFLRQRLPDHNPVIYHDYVSVKERSICMFKGIARGIGIGNLVLLLMGLTLGVCGFGLLVHLVIRAFAG